MKINTYERNKYIFWENLWIVFSITYEAELDSSNFIIPNSPEESKASLIVFSEGLD